MNYKIIYIIFFLIVAQFGLGYSVEYPDTLRLVENSAFSYGEELNYEVSYGVVTAGRGFIKIEKKPVIMYNRKSFDIKFQVESVGMLSWVYDVRDYYRIIVDERGIFPWRAEQKVRENSYKRDFKANFNHYRNEVYTGGDTFEIASYTHSLFSAFYFFRTMDLSDYKKGDIRSLSFFYKDTTLSTEIKMIGRETVESETGRYDCIIIEPQYVKGGLFRSNRIPRIWLTNDEKKIPIKVEVAINLIGDIHVDLVSYKGIGSKIKAKK